MSSLTLPVCPKTGSTSPSLTVHLCLHTAPGNRECAHLERRCGVSKVRAVALMTAVGAGRTGHLLTLPRAARLRQLRRHRTRAAFRGEATRRARVVTAIRQARLTGIRVAVPRAARAARLASQPEGVKVARDRIEVRFSGAQEAVARLYALAKVLSNDYDRFETLVGRGEVSE